MKSLFLIITLIVSSNNLAASNEAQSKTYTHEEFRAAVEKEVARQMKQNNRSQLIDLSKELMRKEEEVKLKELQVVKLEEQLSLNQTGLEKRVLEFQEQQKSFLSCIDTLDRERNQRIQHIVDSVSGMKPQNAADVLSVQEADISVQILGLLDPGKVSKIFNLMDKEVSARLQKQYLSMKK